MYINKKIIYNNAVPEKNPYHHGRSSEIPRGEGEGRGHKSMKV